MNQNVKDLLRLIQFPLLLSLGLVPMPIMIFTYLHPELQQYAWSFPAIYFLLVLLSFFLPGKTRTFYGIVAALGLLLPWCFFLQGEALVLSLLVGVAFSLLLLWSMRIAGWDANTELHAAWIGICLAVQMIGQVVFFFDGYSTLQLLKPVTGLLYLSFYGTIALSMLCMNRRGIHSFTTEQSGTVQRMRRKNIVLVFALISIAAVFSLIPSVLGVISAAVKWIADILRRLQREESIETLPSLTIPTETEEGTFSQIELNVGVHTDILNGLFQVVVGVIMLVGTPLVFVFFWKRIVAACKKLWKILCTYAVDTMLDYEDEVTDTRDSVIQDETNTTADIRIRRIFSDRGMSNTEKIRYRYRQLQKKNPQWQRASTARENLPESVAAIYEKARYSTHPVTQEDAGRFKSETKKI